MASQFNSDDLKNVGQALVMHHSLDILPAIKLILGWDAFFQSASAEFEWRENVHSEFLSCLDARVLGVHLRAEVAKGRYALRR